jgi:outer membrane lipoprotein-sorting protein
MIHKIAIFLAITLISSTLFSDFAFADADEAAVAESAVGSEQAKQDEYRQATALVEQLERHFKSANSYSCVMFLTVTENDKTETQEQNYWFKRPGYFRVEQTGDYQNGTSVIRTPDGKVRVKLSGLLGVVPLPITESLAVGITGSTISNSTFSQFFDGYRAEEKKGIRHTMTRKGNLVLLYNTERPDGRKITITLNPGNKMVAKVVHLYTNGDGFSVEWRNLVWNPKIGESLFTFD